jgi:hypothetical protein
MSYPCFLFDCFYEIIVCAISLASVACDKVCQWLLTGRGCSTGTNIHAFNLLCTTHIIFIALMVVFLVIIIGRLIAPWSVLARAWFKPKTIKLVFVVSKTQIGNKELKWKITSRHYFISQSGFLEFMCLFLYCEVRYDFSVNTT